MSQAIFTLPEHTFLIEFEYMSLFYKNLPFLFGMGGVAISLLFNTVMRYIVFSIKMSVIGYNLYLFFNRKWYFDLLYNHYVLNKFLDLGYQITFKLIDKGVLEILGPQGIYLLVIKISRFVTSFQTGIIYNYVLLMFVMLLLFLAFVLFSEFFFTSALAYIKILLFIITIFLLSNYKR